MSFIWPGALLLLVLVPVGLALDGLLARRRAGRLEAAGMALKPSPAPPSRVARARRRLPPALLVAGLAITTLAMARPQGTISVPHEEGIVVLAFDVSGSMAATDLAPTRMEAARAAATAFVKRQPAGVLVGVVAFSDAGISVQAPTRSQADVLAAIERLQPQRGTSLGQGILVALHAIDVVLNPPPTDYYSNRSQSPSPTPDPVPVPAGTHAPAVVVLLSDGENNESPDPLAAAQSAADRGIRIDTIAIGSGAGADLRVDGFTIHTQPNPDLLAQVAAASGGTAFAATDTGALDAVYATLDTKLVVAPEAIELTGLVAGIGAFLLLVGGLLSLRWLGRLP